MDGIFMKTLLKFSFLCIFVYLMFFLGALLADKQYLRNEIIRIHVVANSDSTADQNAKLAVKDAINDHLTQFLDTQMTVSDAAVAIEEQLPKLESVALQTLAGMGISDTVRITLTEEEFPVRSYDTFTLPSGVYRSLRVKIGNAEGQNWWCVAFPSLCISAAGEFKCAAVNAGLSEELTDTLAVGQDYEVRFYLLDLLGKLENIFSDLED